MNRTQNWYDNGPDPCEQSAFPFQKSDRYDNGTISFPCERSLNVIQIGYDGFYRRHDRKLNWVIVIDCYLDCYVQSTDKKTSNELKSHN